MAGIIYNESELQMNTRLILCIEEHYYKNDEDFIDTSLFIGYSLEEKDYYVRGKRQNIKNKDFVPYAFHCKTSKELCNFIEFVIGSRSLTSIVLYNFNNLREFEKDELTYEFFEKHADINYEMVAYANNKLKRSQIKKYLRILKNTYNWEDCID